MNGYKYRDVNRIPSNNGKEYTNYRRNPRKPNRMKEDGDIMNEKQICEDVLIVNNERIAVCEQEKGHNGKHVMTFEDGSMLKW
jgi:hypothetical protein